MAKRIESLDDPAFGALFTSFAYTAYRLETRQVYDVGYEEEPMRRFLAGDPPAIDLAKNEWAAMIRGAVGAGKTIRRVHVIESGPLTDYLRYEIGVSYPPNVDAGEDIRFLPAGQHPGLDLPDRDHWLFDSRDLWVMDYDRDGRFLFAEQVSDPAEIVRHSYWRDAALCHAISYREYVSSVPGLRRAS